jgi:hypothetical protein
MQVIKPLAVVFSLLAFASVSAFAEDAKKNQTSSQAKPSMSQSDSKSSGSASAGGASSTRSSAGATRLDFDKADKNKDGQLSRAEFDAMLKGDASASAGASAKPDQTKSSSTTK